MAKDKPKRLSSTTAALHWQWRWGDTNHGSVRVWRSDWPGDMFEVFTLGEWIDAKALMQRLGMQCIEAEDNDT